MKKICIFVMFVISPIQQAMEKSASLALDRSESHSDSYDDSEHQSVVLASDIAGNQAGVPIATMTIMEGLRQQEERIRTANTYRILCGCVESQDYASLKSILRMLEHEKKMESIVQFQRDRGINIIDVAQRKAKRTSITVIPEVALYAVAIAALVASHFGKLGACPPQVGSLALYSEIISALVGFSMVYTLARDCFYMRDTRHNKSLKILTKLRKLHMYQPWLEV